MISREKVLPFAPVRDTLRWKAILWLLASKNSKPGSTIRYRFSKNPDLIFFLFMFSSKLGVGLTIALFTGYRASRASRSTGLMIYSFGVRKKLQEEMFFLRKI